MAGCCQSGVISLWGLCTCGLHLVLTTKLTTNAASAVSVVPRETLEKSAFGGILVPAIYSVHRVQIPPSAPKGSHPEDGSLFPPVPFRQAETTTFEGDFFEEYQIATGACGLIGRSGKSTHAIPPARS